ncbi:MAG: PEGA domain-containing protein, partial [Myxococcaceae bacterium]|nr:PEGA domain-containing protein [Myxococcaceae bacterium]
VVVPPGAVTELDVELAPEVAAVLSAQLQVVCAVGGADVSLDGVRVGVTPLYSTLAVPPGTHRVAVTRAGYVAAGVEVTLAEGAQGRVVLELVEDAARPIDADLRLEPSSAQTQVQLSVDGVRRGVDVTSLRLPAGPHTLVFERAGFYPLRRDVTGAAGAVVPVGVTLEPTPELRAELGAQARRHRFAAVLLLAGGGALLAGSTGFLVYSEVTTREQTARLARMTEQLQCATTLGRRTCEQLAADRDALLGVQWAGWLGVSLGALSALAGLIALVTAPDLTPEGATPDGVLAPVFGLSLSPAGGGASVTFKF